MDEHKHQSVCKERELPPVFIENQIPEDLSGDAVEGLHHLEQLWLRELL